MKEKEKRQQQQREIDQIEASRMIEHDRKVLEREKQRATERRQQNFSHKEGLIQQISEKKNVVVQGMRQNEYLLNKKRLDEIEKTSSILSPEKNTETAP